MNRNKSSLVKLKLHPRNKHRQQYDMDLLVNANPGLKSYLKLNPLGNKTIDFFDPEAVKALNKALLKVYYRIDHWDIPKNYLCPPVPGRADYIHYTADLLAESNGNVIPTGPKIKCLDIGVGANCIYPIIGTQEYGWNFLGSDIDPVSIQSALKMVEENESLKGKIELRLQKNKTSIFSGIIQDQERFHLTICNPPFHSSLKEAQDAATKKVSNLKHKNVKQPKLNFGGVHNELWFDGGEVRFLEIMINESRNYKNNSLWFTSLVSKSEHLSQLYAMLERAEVFEHKTINMGQGNKMSRIVAWTFHPPAVRSNWF